MPIVWHVIQLYAVQGFERFLLATGYRGELIERFVAVARLAGGRRACGAWTPAWTRTPAGGSSAWSRALAGERTFCVTYADGLADIDLDALLAFHDAHGALASMTVVRPELQFGVTELEDDGTVAGFREKPRSEHWINGGFFCFAAQRARLPRRRQRARARAAGAPRGRAASCARTATRASGSAWTPTRTRSRSTTCGPPARRRGACGSTSATRWAPRRAPERTHGAGPRGRRRRCELRPPRAPARGTARPVRGCRAAAARRRRTSGSAPRPSSRSLALGEQAAGARDRGDAAGEVDRAPEPVAGARQRRPERRAGAQLREVLALGVRGVDQRRAPRRAAARARARRASPRRRSS